MKTVNDIRHTFLNFFEGKGHEIVRSSSLVPHNDPTLMFTNAGMVQFKDVFTGKEKRDYTRAVSSQKCVRAGGKHNDLENVGHTARHHTFFEMLGNFSFGDYFKEDAISYAWELLTKDFGLSKEKLLVTVYHTDNEAFDIWKKVTGFSDDKIIRIATDDNFWSMGDTGPCGPCTEVFYDHGDHIWGGVPGSPEEDGDRYIEIWNNVFMQFEKHADGSRTDLPKQSVDTGMGLERMSAIIQGVHSNYEIDLMQALIDESAALTGVKADDKDFWASHRVIADHLRSSAFLIADGVLPSNEGRGYVLRRIMRRAMRHAHMLGAKDPMMYRMFPELLTQMGTDYPELGRAKELITATLQQEETRFKRTLDKGLSLLEDESSSLSDGDVLSGDIAFRLYDTYGFPLDLTQDVLKKQNISVDTDGFETAMQKQKEEARKNWSGSGEAATEQIWYDVKEKVGTTEFLGYDRTSTEAQVKALIFDGKEVSELKTGQEGFVIFNQTPCYAESGGQVGDTGRIISEEGSKSTILDTKKKVGGLFVHQVRVEEKALTIGLNCKIQIDEKRRKAIKANHSATHLLHEALRRHLGKHVAQKGSLVTDERLRFDISQPTALTAQDIKSVEEEVNARIRANDPVSTRLQNLDDAIESGALAMFGEKYDEEVRVLSMGGTETAEEGRNAFSVELCGGTHVERTGDIGFFKIVSESAVAAGVRRIEAVTGEKALSYVQEKAARVNAVTQLLNAPEDQIVERIESLLSERKKHEKEMSDLRRKMASVGSAENSDATMLKQIEDVQFSGQVLENIPAKELKPMVDDLKTKYGSAVITLISVSEEGKASIVVGVTQDLVSRFNAVDLVKAGAEVLGGKGGGGRPDMAQAGGPDGKAANDAIASIEKLLSN